MASLVDVVLNSLRYSKVDGCCILKYVDIPYPITLSSLIVFQTKVALSLVEVADILEKTITTRFNTSALPFNEERYVLSRVISSRILYFENLNQSSQNIGLIAAKLNTIIMFFSFKDTYLLEEVLPSILSNSHNQKKMN